MIDTFFKYNEGLSTKLLNSTSELKYYKFYDMIVPPIFDGLESSYDAVVREVLDTISRDYHGK